MQTLLGRARWTSFSALALLTAALIALGLPSPRAQAQPAPDVPAVLTTGQYQRVTRLEAAFPQFQASAATAVIAQLALLNDIAVPGGIILGDLEVQLGDLPAGAGALNLFHEIAPDAPRTEFQASAIYYHAALDAKLDIHVAKGGESVAVGWNGLTAKEQAALIEAYAQAWSDGWVDGGSGGRGGHPGAGGPPSGAAQKPLTTRLPVQQECFAAVWAKPGGMWGGRRWDFRQETGAHLITVNDYARGMTYFQVPWMPEAEDIDPALTITEASYNYWLTPLADPPPSPADSNLKCDVHVEVRFTVSERRELVEFISAPWLAVDQVTLPPHDRLGWERPASDSWRLWVKGEFTPGVEHTLFFDFSGIVPKSYDGVGYGGAYRLDATPLWPGEEQPVDLTITYAPDAMPVDSVVASGGTPVELVQVAAGEYYAARWPAATRNQMLVVTSFPNRGIKCNWGELTVYAPADLIDTVEQLEAVQAIGPIIDYYGELWGDRGINSLPAYVLPEETGVQGFENAGMVFILGGSGGHGGAGGAMGGLTALMAHELSHLWWGYDVNTPRWFAEGMANYGAAKYLEHEALAGQGSNVDDPYFYRRYLMEFALGYEMPLSIERRDELDDSGAIYHNGPASLLTLDARRPYGIDGILRLLHDSARGQAYVSHDELRGIFADQGGDEMAGWWDSYLEQGVIPQAVGEDLTYRRLEHTPERDGYRDLLGWLMSTRRKAAKGDYLGALYCANRALDYRAEPKDYLYLAELTLSAGKLDEAWERCAAMLENPAVDELTRIKLHWLLARVYRAQGDSESELLELAFVAEEGPAAGALNEVAQAQARIGELEESTH